jgi:hypothetical protein
MSSAPYLSSSNGSSFTLFVISNLSSKDPSAASGIMMNWALLKGKNSTSLKTNASEYDLHQLVWLLDGEHNSVGFARFVTVTLRIEKGAVRIIGSSELNVIGILCVFQKKNSTYSSERCPSESISERLGSLSCNLTSHFSSTFAAVHWQSLSHSIVIKKSPLTGASDKSRTFTPFGSKNIFPISNQQ